VLRSLAANVVFMVLIASLAVGQSGKKFTADRHKAAGLECQSCHREGTKKPVESDQCLTCHESFEAVAKRTKDLNPNPHDNHITQNAECTQCHHGHKADDNVCMSCHSSMEFKRKS
jgi:hypothetical protein